MKLVTIKGNNSLQLAKLTTKKKRKKLAQIRMRQVKQ
jgi:hypothetical protein